MAELIVSPLLEAVIDKLGSGLWKELTLLRGVTKDIDKLQIRLSTIKDVLEDAEQKSITDEPLRNWLKRLKDAAYDADDVMDEIQTEALRRRMENHGHLLKGQRLKIYRRRRRRQVGREKEGHDHSLAAVWPRSSIMGLSDSVQFCTHPNFTLHVLSRPSDGRTIFILLQNLAVV